jgi:nicotinate-nucleotide adenylyltransferase
MAGIGVLGGTFDPPHLGHLAAAEDVAWKLGLERVLFVPNRHPPHKQDQRVSGVRDRVAMVQLAIAGNPRFQLSTIELERDGLSYTIDTLRALRCRMQKDVEIYFLVGSDAIGQLHTWHDPDAILEEFGLVVMERPTGSAVDWGAAAVRFPKIREQTRVVDVAELEISSKDIRRRVAEGAPIRYYVQPAVERYIRLYRLYGAA